MTASPLAEIGAEVRVISRFPKVLWAYYLGPVPNGTKHRLAIYNLRLGRWIGYTAHAGHIIR